MKLFKMVVTDFDGTLFNDRKKVHRKDYETLLKLGEMGIERVIATGRSSYSAYKVLEHDFPIDYLIFSSGAGIINWKTKEIIKNISISSDLIKTVYTVLEKTGYDFMLHKKIPDNHYFYPMKQSGSLNTDFDERCRIYSSYCLNGGAAEILGLSDATQFVVIIPVSSSDEAAEMYSLLKDKLPGLKVIRATSPIDNKSLWIEIFNHDVSKAKAAEDICERKKISRENVMVIGNDYNDIDMLNWGGGNSFVVENAPDNFKKIFRVVSSNNCCGFSEAVEMWLKDR